MVPLSIGVKQDEAWPLMPAGSSTSMSNFLPLKGRLAPRSRLSSINTIRTLAGTQTMTPQYRADGLSTALWISNSTLHGLMQSNGSISKASFVSAFGLGVSGLAGSSYGFEYAYAYSGTLDQNMLVAAPIFSQGTLIVVYQTTTGGSGVPLYSYLTSAPRAGAVGAFDNYVVAFNIVAGGSFAPTRVQWSQRGNPSNWTGEGSGFEDLLDMRGGGRKVLRTADSRLLLFSDLEIWYAVGATYPAQFSFYPLDRTVGCPAPRTVQECDLGTIFLGSDSAIRLLPRGGSTSQVISASMSETLRSYAPHETISNSWGIYDGINQLYHLFLETSGTYRGFVLNVATGEWAFADYNTPPVCGTTFGAPNGATVAPVFFGNSTGTVYSLNSKTSLENGSVVTSKWQSSPIAADLPGSYKQLTKVCLDYRATSKSTVTLKISQDGGNNYETTGVAMSLISAPVSGRVEQDVYNGGAFPAIELTSTSTGYELHRLDVSMNLGGRK